MLFSLFAHSCSHYHKSMMHECVYQMGALKYAFLVTENTGKNKAVKVLLTGYGGARGFSAD
jgi:hypothetical protein